MKRAAVYCFFALVVSWAGVAGATTVHLRSDRTTISQDDTVQVRVVAQGSYDEVVPPSSDGFDFESTGRSSQVSIIGSTMQRSDTYTFVGKPRRVGKHVIGPALLRMRGREVARSHLLHVEVTSARAALGAAVTPEDALDMRRFRGEAFFVRPQLSVQRPYAGQPFVLSYQLFWSRRVHVSNIRELAGPSYTGFEVEDLLGGKPSEQEPARFGGAPYFRQTTRKALLTAATAGTFEVLGPRYRVEAGDIFATRAYKVGPPPIAITVRAVPARGRPPAYEEGNVGRLEVDGWLLDRDQPVRERRVKVGERVVVHLEVRGTGNLFGVAKVVPSPLVGMRVEPLPGRADEHVKTTANGTEGKRVWQYVLTFEAGGRYEIPAVFFAAFDPFAERFVTSSAGPFVVMVDGPAATPGLQGTAAGTPKTPARPVSRGVVANTSDQALAPQPSDLLSRMRPIAATARLAQTSTALWTSSPWFWRLVGVPWAFALLFGFGRAAASLRARGGSARREDGALSVALRAIEAAGSAGDEGYVRLRKAVANYLQTRADLRLAGATYGAVREHLAARGGDPAAVDALVVALERCDAMQYAPGEGAQDIEQLALTLREAVVSLDTQLPKVAQRGRSASVVVALLLAGAAASSMVARPALALSVDEAFGAANHAYIAGDYKAARSGFERLLRHDLPAASIHYNLGNTLVRLGRMGEGIGHYKQALRLAPGEALSRDIHANLKLCREQLAERSRRRHRILHIFDESAEFDVAVARAAPRSALGMLALGGGFAAFFLLLIGWWPGRTTPPQLSTRLTLLVVLVVHITAGAWLFHAQRMDGSVRYSVVVEEDAPLGPCAGVGETIDLPEGLEVRQLRERPDGRIEIRLPNGRTGCMKPETLYRTS